MRFFLNHRVLMSINGWVYSGTTKRVQLEASPKSFFRLVNSQYVLMILCQSPWTDNVTIVAGLSRINVYNAHYARSTSLNDNAAGLIKLIPIY